MIYTLTYQRALNFGAVLQAYALVKFLNSNGHAAQVIDYLPNYMHWQTKRPMKSLTGTIQKYKKYQKFSEFRRSFMPMTPRTYYRGLDLSTLSNIEAVVVGSDQVWNPSLHGKSGFDTSFVFEGLMAPRKIAYAASAGSVRWRDVASQPLLGALYGFDSIGCREAILAEDILECFDNKRQPSARDLQSIPNVDVVLDPSLLIDDYEELEVDNLVPDSDYIVSYVVGSGEMLSTFDRRVAEAKKLLGLPVIHIGAKGIHNADDNILDIGPREWLTYIKNAKYVITNSFHGCAFSINFNKQFIAIPHKLAELNQRQVTLLNGVGLSQRLLNDEQIIDAAVLSPIEYESVNTQLAELVRHSQQFLLDAVGRP